MSEPIILSVEREKRSNAELRQLLEDLHQLINKAPVSGFHRATGSGWMTLDEVGPLLKRIETALNTLK
jgi:hypothetical protein